MARFHYQARRMGGEAVSGVVEAEDRQGALAALTEQGLFPSLLEAAPQGAPPHSAGAAVAVRSPRPAKARHATRTPGTSSPATLTQRASTPPAPVLGSASGMPADPVPAREAPAPAGLPEVPHRAAHGGRVSRKEVTAFTREMATLLGATIPIPAALEGLALEEENQALQAVLRDLLSSVKMGTSLSASMERHPRLFPPFYSSMVRVGEESGALDKVLADLSELLEHEDETRGDALAAVAYPCFVLVLGAVTAFVLLAFVLPQLFQMLQGMVDVLPLPTRMLLAASAFFEAYWPWVLGGALAAVLLARAYVRSPAGGLAWDAWKMRVPVMGAVFRAAALGRFARTLGILLRSGVSLLPALEIVRNTVRNRFVARSLLQVSEEARGGDSLALPLRKTKLFPPTVIQMVSVGEETGRLDEMLLKIAGIEERQVRLRSRTLISLLAPALILVVGTMVGFIVIALLLPIFRMSQLIQ